MKLSPNTLRRAAATIAMAGVAGLGTVALAPAASAALPSVGGSTLSSLGDATTSTLSGVTSPVSVDGSRWIVEGTGVGGPVAFMVTDHGRVAVFFCDPLKPNKLQNVCQPDPTTAPDRF